MPAEVGDLDVVAPRLHLQELGHREHQRQQRNLGHRPYRALPDCVAVEDIGDVVIPNFNGSESGIRGF